MNSATLPGFRCQSCLSPGFLAAICRLLYSNGDQERSRSGCGSGHAASAGHQVAAQGNAAGRAQADRAVCRGRAGFERHPADPVRHRPQQGLHREPLRPRSRALPRAHAGQQAGPAQRAGLRSPQGATSFTPASASERLGRRHPVRRELRRRRAVPGGVGRFHPRPERRFPRGQPHGRRVRFQARQLRDRRGRSAVAKRRGTMESCSRRPARTTFSAS